MYHTLPFDQYSRLVIRLNIFRFSAIYSKMNLKLEKNSIVCRARRDKSTDVWHQTFKTQTKPCYSFEDRGTDRQMESISECTLKDL